MQVITKGKTHLSILSTETSLGHLGGREIGVLLLHVSVTIEIIDFPQPRI